MTRLALAVLIVAIQAQPAPQPAPAPQPPPSTDIYLIEMSAGIESLKNAKPQPIAVEKGYDNQPFFTPDSRMVLFTANRDGKQMDIYEHTRGGATRKLIGTPEGEYSPTITPDGGISVIRVEADGTQRLWRFDRNGTAPRVLLPDVKPVGYHAWIDNETLALFVLGQPATLRLTKVGPGPADILVSGIGRSLHRIPGRRAVSFVQREGDDRWVVKALDAETRQVSVLTDAVAGSADRDSAWMPEGTLLMSAGTQLFAWKAGDKGWRAVYDVKPHGLGNISRMAVAPDGKAIAIVVGEGKP